MPNVVPSRDLESVDDLLTICRSSSEPVYIVPENGDGDFVMMRADVYERALYVSEICDKVDEADRSIARGDVVKLDEMMATIRKRHGL